MSIEDDILTLETEIKALGERLCATIKDDERTKWVTFMSMDFSAGDFEDGISRLTSGIRKYDLELTKQELAILEDMKQKIPGLRQLYAEKLEASDGFKDPIAHMNTLMKAADEIPASFHRRYGISRGSVKALWLATPAFQERFCRERIAKAVARKGNRTGHYLLIQRRFKLTDEQTRRLVDDMWENPEDISTVFYELLDWRKIASSYISENGQAEVKHLQAKYGTEPQ